MRRYLIDECLSTRLVGVAHAAGCEANHVAWIGLPGAKDWTIAKYAETHGWTLVTRNGADFRGSDTDLGAKGIYAGIDLHEGLICLNGPDGLNGALQVELFRVALDMVARLGDITNQVIDVTLENEKDDHVTVAVYPVPRDGICAEPPVFFKAKVKLSSYQDDILIVLDLSKY